MTGDWFDVETGGAMTADYSTANFGGTNLAAAVGSETSVAFGVSFEVETGFADLASVDVTTGKTAWYA